MTELAQINYQPLRDIDHAGLKTIKMSFGGYGWLVIDLVIVVSIGLMYFGFFGIIPLVLYFSFIGSRVNKYKNQVWQNFAGANGWTLDQNTSEYTLVSPSVQYGHSQKLSPIIKANLAGLDCDLFTYNTTTGSGKYQQTHYFTVAMAQLPAVLPHILLTSKKAHADVRQNLDNHENLQLEGDFDKFFNLQVEKGQEIDVLTIITPDVMQALINYNQAEDIEIFNNNLYFILNSDKRDYTSVEKLIQSVAGLSVQIIENLKQRGISKPVIPAVTTPS